MGSPPELQVVRAPEGEARWVRIRIWLAGAMWVPVLTANPVAVALGITLPFLDRASASADPADRALGGGADPGRAGRRA